MAAKGGLGRGLNNKGLGIDALIAPKPVTKKKESGEKATKTAAKVKNTANKPVTEKIATKEVIKEVKIYAKKPGATSKFHCVYFDKAKKSWNYKFVHEKQKYNGRGFKTELEAAKAYNNHVVKIKGLDAILNDVGE